MTEIHVAARAVGKRYGGNVALTNVDVEIKRGLVHCLIGENGAGKSTLGRLLAGVEQPDEGFIEVLGSQVQFRSPSDALGHGITAMAQEVALANAMTVEENALLGVEKSRWGVVNKPEQRKFIQQLIEECGFTLDTRALVGDLRISDQQKVEIVKALARRAELIIMDEPTASLDRSESQVLLDTVRRLRDSGTTVVLVSHHLEEVLDVADAITVLRNGVVVHSGPREGHNRESLIQLMLGRSLESSFPRKSPVPSHDISATLQVKSLSSIPDYSEISFDVRPGEILGIAGLVGSGRTELVRAIAGADRFESGEVILAGHSRIFRSPRAAMKAGIFLIPEDRKTQGLILARSIRENISISTLPMMSFLGVVLPREEKKLADGAAKRMDIRALSLENEVSTLSGGNQQKVLFARAALIQPKVLLVDEPTKGVDIGAKFAIHQLLVDIAANGTAVVVVSSEHEELMGIAHRILVMQSGAVVAEFAGPEFNDQEVKRAIVVPHHPESSPLGNIA